MTQVVAQHRVDQSFGRVAPERLGRAHRLVDQGVVMAGIGSEISQSDIQQTAQDLIGDRSMQQSISQCGCRPIGSQSGKGKAACATAGLLIRQARKYRCASPLKRLPAQHMCHRLGGGGILGVKW